MTHHETERIIQVDSQDSNNSRWIWLPSERLPQQIGKTNLFSWFRCRIHLESVPEKAELLFAADSNARLYVNGVALRRKMTRYAERSIRAEVVNAGPHLQVGDNVVVVLHHNWGDIVTFQRTGNSAPRLYVAGSWIATGSHWRCRVAQEFLHHDEQIVGIAGEAPRVRFPIVLDGRKTSWNEVHAADFDDSRWSPAEEVKQPEWACLPPVPVETPPQRSSLVLPVDVLAAGAARRPAMTDVGPRAISRQLSDSVCLPHSEERLLALALCQHRNYEIQGEGLQTRYLTLDFHRPVHGYPFLEIEADEGITIDFAYGELAETLREGKVLVREDGWIDTEGVVGRGYADRYITRSGLQQVEIPDERTARWVGLHVTFPNGGGRLQVRRAGIVSSQFPVERVGSFECGHPLVDQAVRLCLLHAEITMTDSYVDTPGREDGQWIEDARERALLSQHWYGDSSMRRFLVRTNIESQQPDGNTHPFAPSNYPAHPGVWDWTIQWAAALYDEFLWSADREFVRTYFPHLTLMWDKVLELAGEDGLWRTNHVLADIRVSRIPSNPQQSSGVIQPWLVERLRMSAVLADAIGQNEQAERWRLEADRLQEAYRRWHIIPPQANRPPLSADVSDPSDPNLERGIGQAGHTVAIYADVFPAEHAVETIDYVFPDPDGSPPTGVTRWNNPTYFYRALRALHHVGRTERAVRHLIERFAPYLPANPANWTTPRLQGGSGGPLPEYWVSRVDLGLRPGEINIPQPPDETGSHSWPCVPLIWLHDALLGVTITEPGGSKLRIAPHAAGLPYVTGTTMTPKGKVYVHYDPEALELKVEIPAEVQATLLAPPEMRERRVRRFNADGTNKPICAKCPIELAAPGLHRFSCF